MEKLVLKILITVLPLISPEVKDALHKGIAELKDRASKTPNKFDDILVDFLDNIIVK